MNLSLIDPRVCHWLNVVTLSAKGVSKFVSKVTLNDLYVLTPGEAEGASRRRRGQAVLYCIGFKFIHIAYIHVNLIHLRRLLSNVSSYLYNKNGIISNQIYVCE